MYVLDTNTLIYFFKGVGRVGERFLTISPQDIGLSTIVLFELETGIAKSLQATKRRRQLDTLISSARLLPFGHMEATAAATIRARLESAGTPIGPLDTLIGATALAAGATLVTHNVREFSRIPGLSTEDWF
jgi:tRNA(fMet)-specific endonuclease VapC